MSEAQKLEAIIRLLGTAKIRMKRGGHVGLALSLLFGASTSHVLRSWYWRPVWLEFKGKDFHQMWTTSDRGDWLLWFCTHMIDQTRMAKASTSRSRLMPVRSASPSSAVIT